MACLTRLERLKLLEDCNRKFEERDFAGQTKHNDHLGELIGVATRKVLKRRAKFADFRNSLLKQEGKIRGELKLKDLEIHVGIERDATSKASQESPAQQGRSGTRGRSGTKRK